MSLDRLIGIADHKVLIVGTTPIALAAEGLFAEVGAAVQALDIAPAEPAMSEAVATSSVITGRSTYWSTRRRGSGPTPCRG